MQFETGPDLTLPVSVRLCGHAEALAYAPRLQSACRDGRQAGNRPACRAGARTAAREEPACRGARTARRTQGRSRTQDEAFQDEAVSDCPQGRQCSLAEIPRLPVKRSPFAKGNLFEIWTVLARSRPVASRMDCPTAYSFSAHRSRCPCRISMGSANAVRAGIYWNSEGAGYCGGSRNSFPDRVSSERGCTHLPSAAVWDYPEFR